MTTIWTDEMILRLIDLVKTTKCGYCLDGTDLEATDTICPECGQPNIQLG